MNEYLDEAFIPMMTNKDFVYSRIGMALTSAQRVEFITGQLLNYLIEYDKTLYGLTSNEFLEKAAKSKNSKKTLGAIFNLFKLNPSLIIEEELDNYLQKRNLLAHGFWTTFLQNGASGKEAVEFCNEFGKHSNRLESFFKGFLYFLALKHVKHYNDLGADIKELSSDFEYFMSSLAQQNLKH